MGLEFESRNGILYCIKKVLWRTRWDTGLKKCLVECWYIWLGDVWQRVMGPFICPKDGPSLDKANTHHWFNKKAFPPPRDSWVGRAGIHLAERSHVRILLSLPSQLSLLHRTCPMQFNWSAWFASYYVGPWVHPERT